MFSHLSWSDYVQTVLSLLAVYYAVILLRYYRQELTCFLIRGPKVAPALVQPVCGKDQPFTNRGPGDVTLIHSSRKGETPAPLIQSLRDEVAAFIPEAVSNGFEKEALLSSLAFILSKYSSPDIVLHRDEIQQWIGEQCRTHSSVRFSESELACLWKS